MKIIILSLLMLGSLAASASDAEEAKIYDSMTVKEVVVFSDPTSAIYNKSFGSLSCTRTVSLASPDRYTRTFCTMDGFAMRKVDAGGLLASTPAAKEPASN